MSRCFPYLPSYLFETEIESLKKKKERLEDEAKTERKHEKKERKKKVKRSDQKHELSKESKKILKRKYEELGLVESKDKHESPQHQHKSKKPRDEKLETSGLSEEHGQPSTGLANLGSPQRSQDSSKRGNSGRMPSPSVSITNSGSTIRIKLQSKSRDSVPKAQTFKPKGSVSAPQLAKSRDLAPLLQTTKNRDPVSVPQGSKVREQVPIPQTSKPRTISAPKRPRSEPVPQILEPRAPVVQTPKLKEPQLESLVPKPKELVSHAPKVVPKANGTYGVPKQQSSWKSETGLVPCSSVARRSLSKEPVMKAKIEPCIPTEIPKEKEVFHELLPAVRPKQKDPAPSAAVKQDIIRDRVQPVESKATKAKAESAPFNQQQAQVLNAKRRMDGDGLPHVLKQDRRPVVSGMPPVTSDEPCFSGRILDSGEKRKSKEKHSHHSSKKSKRKEADKLYEELITNWKPPVVDQLQEDGDNLDWLMPVSKKRRVENDEGEDKWLSKSISKCTVGEGLLDHTNGMPCSYQTTAVYLPQLDMYQLPYVFPF